MEEERLLDRFLSGGGGGGSTPDSGKKQKHLQKNWDRFNK
jgi:hypothetical protein